MTTTRSIVRILMCAVFALIVCIPSSFAQQRQENRGESFASPTFRDMAIASVMLGAYDTDSNEVIDEYAKLMYCSLYREKFKLDFEWNNIRRELMNKIKSKREYFRTKYEITGVVYLGRYSFETQDFPFVRNTALVNVGSLMLLNATRYVADTSQSGCSSSAAGDEFFPLVFVFMMQQPLTLDRIKMPMDDAEKLLKQMDLMNNKERALHVRFRVRLMGSGTKNPRGPGRLMMRGELVAVDLFYDPEMTKHFASVALR